MLNKGLRYYHTLRHLKPVQIFYQVFYRVKKGIPFLNKVRGSYGTGTSVQLLFSSFYLINANDKLLGVGHFKFLNIGYQFTDKINWKFNEFGKLWNYNLQYFDYLLDENASDDYKKLIIDEVASQIIEGNFKLEPYPVSLRLINWILYNAKSGYLSQSMEKAIRIQIGFLRHNIEYHIQANHLLENYVSLLTSSYFIRDKKLFQFSSNHLIEQLSNQILGDGGHYESSPMYHQIVLSKLLIVFEIEKKQPFGNKQYLEILHSYINKMFNWLHLIYFKSGSMPLLNDSAPGVAPDAKVLWECKKQLSIKSETKEKLGESGYRKLSMNDFELIVDAGNIKPAYQPSHAHSDMLTFCLQYKGKNLIVDPGISTYESNRRRLLERSTTFHNTVTINSESQSDVWASFRVGKRARVRIEEENERYVRASHDGYRRGFKVDHRRSFALDGTTVTVTDEFIGEKKFSSNVIGECRFYFDHTVDIQLNDSKVVAGGITICFENAEKVLLSTYQQPLAFNRLVDSSCLVIVFRGYLFTKIQPE